MVGRHPQALLLRFHFCKIALPLDLIILVIFIEEHLGVHEVLYDLFATAVVEIVCPLGIDDLGLLVVVEERVLCQPKRPHVYIVGSKCAEEEQTDDSIDAAHDDRASTQPEVPDLKYG